MVQPDLAISGCLTPRPFGFSPAELSGVSLLRVLHADEHVAFVQTARALLAAASGSGSAVDAPACAARVVHRVAVSGAATPLIVDSTLSVLPGTPQRLLVASRCAVPVSASPASGIFRARLISAHLGASPGFSRLSSRRMASHLGRLGSRRSACGIAQVFPNTTLPNSGRGLEASRGRLASSRPFPDASREPPPTLRCRRAAGRERPRPTRCRHCVRRRTAPRCCLRNADACIPTSSREGTRTEGPNCHLPS